MKPTFRSTMLAGVSLWALSGAVPAVAQQSGDERVYRQEALAHARAVTAAWRRLERFILAGSAGTPDPDGTSVSGWSGPVPPPASGWLADWTLRGVQARYCEDTLLVYLAPERLKGVGRDHRAVQAAPHAYAGGGAQGRAPVLHWLEAGRARGAAGRPPVTLPSCLSDAAFGGPLPSGRAALAGTVRDPYSHTTERVTRERSREACAAGEHGNGRTRVREVTRTRDERGNPVGDPVYGPWQVLIDECRADYTAWEHYTLVCRWDAGPPHNRRLEGREIWRRRKSVTAQGETLGAPEFVSTSCWNGKVPVPPTAVVSETAQTEANTAGCPSGYTGSRDYRRTVTRRATQFPWDAAPIVRIEYGPWILATDNCRAAILPEWAGEGDGGGDAGDFGGADAGTGGADGDSCGPDPDAGADSCSVDGSGGGDGGGDGAGDGAGDGGLCFLTTAVVEHRGVEADDGPTLTALRRFRDGYMMQTPERRAMVADYYAIAPGIAAAIPPAHPDWDWIGGRIDAAVAVLAAGDEDRAFAIYAAMVRRLSVRWPMRWPVRWPVRWSSRWPVGWSARSTALAGRIPGRAVAVPGKGAWR